LCSRLEWQRERIVAQSPNCILDNLPQNIFAALQPHLTTVKLVFGETVADAGEPVKLVYFPHTGVISLVVVMEVGEMIETAMVGRDGAANATTAMDGKLALQKGIVQVAGSASAINPDKLRSIAADFEPLRALLIRHEQVLFAQAQQSAGCNASHTTEARMCRWLLRIRDLTQSDEMNLTQEFLAQMLGVARTSVSIIAGTLQTAGLISYRRGKIKITDIDAVRAGACECYEKVRSHYEMMLIRE
jgi:Crp-like helix-turn-helix protein